MDETHIQPAWYVVHTRSRFEKLVFEGFRRKSLEAFFPKITVMSKRRDRRKRIQVPLFPGYVFIRSNLNPHERLEIVKTAGVVRLVGSKAGPIPVPDEAIHSLQIMVTGDNSVETGTQFKRGNRVMVVEGPFIGVIGTFVRYRGFKRLVVNIEALGQYAAVSVPEEHVERLPEIV